MVYWFASRPYVPAMNYVRPSYHHSSPIMASIFNIILLVNLRPRRHKIITKNRFSMWMMKPRYNPKKPNHALAFEKKCISKRKLRQKYKGLTTLRTQNKPWHRIWESPVSESPVLSPPIFILSTLEVHIVLRIDVRSDNQYVDAFHHLDMSNGRKLFDATYLSTKID